MAKLAGKDEKNFPLQGLGCGVDATNPAPLKNRKMHPVRLTMAGLKNVTVDNSSPVSIEKKSYTISSAQSLKANISGSLSTGLPVEVSIEGEYARDVSRELKSDSIKHVSRRVYFQPLGSERYTSAGRPDDAFEQKLYEWLIQHIPIKGVQKSDYEAVEKQMASSRTVYNSFIDAAYIFIKTEGITHYVNHIDLGAAKYTLSSSKSRTLTKKGGVKVNVPTAAGGEGSVESSDSETVIKSSEQTIGAIGPEGELKVKAGIGEAVVGYKLLPISALIASPEMKKVVQEAVLKYMGKASGPFLISGGLKNDLYLKVNDKDEIRATEKKSDASLFVVEKTVALGEFTVAFFGSQEDKKVKGSRLLQYLMTDSRLTGYDAGPLKVGRHRATSYGAKFILQRFPPGEKKSKRVFLNSWEADACYLRVAPRLLQKKSYIGLKEDKSNRSQSIMVCKHKKSEDGVNGVNLQLQLHRPESETAGRVTVFTGPSGGSDASVSLDEGEDDFEDFADEYDQALDEGEDGFDFSS